MLQLRGITKTFGETRAVDGIDLDIEEGEFVTLLGPSGCGKTTTLRLIAGFEYPTSGQILLRGTDIASLPPQKRGFGMVFQNYALFPHLNVRENVAFGLKTQKLPKTQIAERVTDALQRVDLAGYEKRKVHELSGGQQQRVALARAIAPHPTLILLDEPLSNLDAALRERTRIELRTLLKRVGITSIFVTHDQEEAFALSDRIVLMTRGTVQQTGTAEELYHVPTNRFVASFIGRANMFDTRVTAVQGDHVSVEMPGGAHWIISSKQQFQPGDVVTVMSRPDALSLITKGNDALPGDIGGVVSERRFAGAHTYYHVRTATEELVVEGAARAARIGETVHVRLVDPKRTCVFREAK